MSTFNRVVLIGFLGADPEVKVIEGDVKVAEFAIATHQVYSKDGIAKEVKDWHDVVAWRALATFAQSHLQKGSKVLVEGKLKTSSWTDPEGVKKRNVYVLADQIRFMDKKKQASEELQEVESDSLPF